MSTRAAICLCAVMALAHADGELDQHLQAGISFFCIFFRSTEQKPPELHTCAEHQAKE
jgi:hypothetical protein